MIKVIIPITPVEIKEQGETIKGFRPSNFARIEEPGGISTGVVSNPLSVWLMEVLPPHRHNEVVFVIEGAGPHFNSVQDEPVNPQES